MSIKQTSQTAAAGAVANIADWLRAFKDNPQGTIEGTAEVLADSGGDAYEAARVAGEIPLVVSLAISESRFEAIAKPIIRRWMEKNLQ